MVVVFVVKSYYKNYEKVMKTTKQNEVLVLMILLLTESDKMLTLLL